MSLFEKDGFILTKNEKNICNEQSYNIQFTLENPNINIESIINFDIIKLIYELNPDIYEKGEVIKINEQEAIITLVMKHLFEDIGMAQNFVFLHVKMHTRHEHNHIFEAETIQTYRPENMSDQIELINIEKMIIICETVTPHKINFIYNIYFEEDVTITPFFEKIIWLLATKVFKRVKQFIELAR